MIVAQITLHVAHISRLNSIEVALHGLNINTHSLVGNSHSNHIGTVRNTYVGVGGIYRRGAYGIVVDSDICAQLFAHDTSPCEVLAAALIVLKA